MPTNFKASVDIGRIDYCYEAHDSSAALYRLKGRVVKIQGLYEKYVPSSHKLPNGIPTLEGVDGVLRELVSANPRSEFLHSAVGWGRRDDEREISAYIVELENCSVKPSNKE